MGRRKTRKAPPKKMAEKMDTTFDCPFCNHEKSVEAKMDKKKNVGVVRCRVCGADYQTRINYLSDPIDVYSEWIDECQRINQTNDDDDEEGGQNADKGGDQYGNDYQEDDDDDDDADRYASDEEQTFS